LARKQLVVVKADPEDRRVRRIDLTNAGKALLDHDPVHRLTSAIDALSAEKQREFAATLETLHGRLAKA
jgi:DNA-binding MarR family transcriptional regulator